MAEYSKQYCKEMDMGFDGDFDVYEEWSKLKPDHGVNYICEGFGFTMIAKEDNNDTVWVYKDSKWVDFDDVVLKAKSEA